VTNFIDLLKALKKLYVIIFNYAITAPVRVYIAGLYKYIYIYI